MLIRYFPQQNVNRLRSEFVVLIKNTRTMRILEFYNKFPTEESCKEKFKEYRLKEGIRCTRCEGTHHYWKKKREQWECKRCARRITLKSGTVMENSKLPYQYWFIAMHLLTCTKKSFSAKEVQRELGHNRYEPICHACPAGRGNASQDQERYGTSG
jgi:DNA-directed RNA polymerase subunit RPC12/RpoP